MLVRAVRQTEGVALGHRVSGTGAAPPPGVAHGDVGLSPAVVALKRLLSGEWTRPDQIAVRGGRSQAGLHRHREWAVREQTGPDRHIHCACR